MHKALKFVGVGLVALALLMLPGCEWLDAALLPGEGGAPSKVEAVGTIAAPFLPSPWGVVATGATGVLTTLWAAIRGKDKDKWKKFASTTAAGLEEFLKTPKGQAIEKDIKEYLAAKHDAAGVYDFVKAYVEKFDH